MRRLMIISSVLILFLALGGVAAADLTNGGFETGNLTGWTVTLNGGAASVATSANDAYGTPTYTPVEGSYFAALTAGTASQAQTLSQTSVHLNAGDILSGYAAFAAFDYLPYNDSAFVKVNNTTLWSASIGSVGNYGHTPWTYWEYIAAAAGDYTLTLGVLNSGDSLGGSKAFFDANVLTTSAVPLPGAVWLLGSGLVGLLGFRRLKG